MKSPEKEPHTYGHWVLAKMKKQFKFVMGSFQQRVLDQLYVRDRKGNISVKVTLSVNSDVNGKCKTRKLWAENLGRELYDLLFGKEFLNVVSKVQDLEKICKWALIKIKNVYSVKYTVREWKDREQTYASKVSDKCLVSRIYKEF